MEVPIELLNALVPDGRYCGDALLTAVELLPEESPGPTTLGWRALNKSEFPDPYDLPRASGLRRWR